MYEKYVSSRDQYKCEYEDRLKEELETIRSQTNTEIERLRTSTKELYERENRNLREAREMAILEKEKSESSGQELYARYEQLLNEFRTLQTSGEQRLLDLQTEVKLKAFEAERSHLAYEETCKNLKEYQLEIEKLEAKYEVLLKEYYAMEGAKSKKITELESELSSKNIRLDSYEKIEQELDNVVLQAAEVEEESNAEKVLLAYGYGANIGANAKRRLKQSVDLARRVLLLERTNATLKKELEAERENVQEKTDEVKSCKDLLESAQQPQSYLIESIQNRDELLKKHKKSLQDAEQRIRDLQEERLQMMQTQNQMSQDMERLLNHQAEISLIKQILVKMSAANAGITIADSETDVYKPGFISFSKTWRQFILFGTFFGSSERGSNHKKNPENFLQGYFLLFSKQKTYLWSCDFCQFKKNIDVFIDFKKGVLFIIQIISDLTTHVYQCYEDSMNLVVNYV